MPFLVALTSLLLVTLLGDGLLRTSWASRFPQLPLAVLVAPLISLGFSLWLLVAFGRHVCWLGAPPVDALLDLVLPLAMVLVASGALVLALVRLCLVWRLTARRSLPISSTLQTSLVGMARRFGIAAPTLLLTPSSQPQALVCGWPGGRPRLLLSTWMSARLDAREMEGVLAHELAHIARRDHLVAWLALLLRDAFCYLPSSWAAFRKLQHQQELTCDDLAVGVTGRPLALASALAKVWHSTLGPPPAAVAGVGLAGARADIEGRIRRLMEETRQPIGSPSLQQRPLVRAGGTAAAVLGLQGMNLALLFVPMGCGSLLHMLGW
ncbi:MAG: M56 family metallopeptidase [Chloroflexota bacterium]